MGVPGIGPIIASAMVTAIGNGAFAKGRDFAACLGLVPKQMSTGDRTILGRISKRGLKESVIGLVGQVASRRATTHRPLGHNAD